MLSTGIDIGMDVMNLLNDVRGNKADFVVFKLKDQKSIECVETFPQTDPDILSFKNDTDKYTNWDTRVYPKLLSTLCQESEPMFVVLDFKYIYDSRKCSKLYFIGWCPEKTSIKAKMLFSITYGQLANSLNIPTRITWHTKSDIQYEELYRHIH